MQGAPMSLGGSLRLVLSAAVAALVIAMFGAVPAGAEQASDPTSAVSGRLAAGGEHTCVLLHDGTVRCWGVGSFGRLGYGNTDTIGDDETPASAGPVNLGAGRTALAIAAGGAHTCAVLDNGTVRCWGGGGQGQLGYGNSHTIGDDEAPGSVGPVDLGVGRTAVAISAGSNHTCALLDNGTVRCWGIAGQGQLGYGNTNDIGDNEVPGSVGPVDLGAGRTAVAISAGGNHTCALLDNGTVRCWGDGTAGQLGYANTNAIGDNEPPGSVGPVFLGSGRTAVAIAAGTSHTCAVLDDGTVRCWGQGINGALGHGNTNDIGDDETPGSIAQVDLGPGRTAGTVTAGQFHTCAVLDNRAVRCWGNSGTGQLGYANGDTIGDDETPGSAGPVNLGAGRTAVALAAGGLHTCAVLDNGTVRCWGFGGDGRLGSGNTNDIGDNETPGSAGPVALGGEVAVPPARPTTASGRIAAGADALHTCALLDNGAVRCWGDGGQGRLGYANTDTIGDDEIPGSVGTVNLGSGRSAVAVSAGALHTCAVLDNGAVRCWGFGGGGRLGYGNTNDIGDDETPGSAGPVNLGTGRSTVAIAANFAHTCAVLDNGTVRCWGDGGQGRLGYGNTNTIGDNETPGSAGPVNLGAGRTAVGITAGELHTCALLDNGTVRCWGSGVLGRLGYGNTNDIGDNETPGSVGPVDLGAGRTAVAISAGDNHTCALLDNGTVRCWGEGFEGQLGYGNTNDIGDDETPASAGPVDLGAGRTAVAIASAGFNTCALLDNGTVRCWGVGNRLGYGNTNTIGDDETPGSAGPVNLGAGRTAVAISAGFAHTCAVLDNATVRCWGESAQGELGYGNTDTIGDDETPDSVGPVDFGGPLTLAANPPVVAGGGTLAYPENAPAQPVSPAVAVTEPDGERLAAASVSITSNYQAGADGLSWSDNTLDDGITLDAAASDAQTVVLRGSATPAQYQAALRAIQYQNSSDAPATADRTVTFALTDASRTTGAGTTTIAIGAADDAPVAVGDAATVREDSAPTQVDVLANDTDVDAGPKQVESVADPAHGQTTVAAGQSAVGYRPDAGFCGTDTFAYSLNGGAQANVTMTVLCVAAATPAGRIVIKHPKTTFNKRGAAVVLSCIGPRSARCKGKATLRPNSRKGRAGKSAKFSIGAGRTKTIRVPLPAATRARLGRRHKAVVRATARLSNGSKATRLLTVLDRHARR